MGAPFHGRVKVKFEGRCRENDGSRVAPVSNKAVSGTRTLLCNQGLAYRWLSRHGRGQHADLGHADLFGYVRFVEENQLPAAIPAVAKATDSPVNALLDDIRMTQLHEYE